MIFWIVCGALALMVAGALGASVLRGRVGDAPPAAYDLEVYRDQLKEVDRDLARGILAEDEAQRVRAEVSRRILAADAQLRADGARGGVPGGLNTAAAALTALAVLGGSFALYWQLGAPGYRDLPREARIAASDAERADRLSQAEAEERAGPLPEPRRPDAETAAVMERLRAAMKKTPDEPRGLDFLARNEAMLGNTAAALKAQSRLVEVRGDAADASDYAFLADLMITAAKGYVSAEAEEALRAALARDPRHGTARYYLGLYLAQVDRPDMAFRMWEQLLRDSRPDAPWVPNIRAGIVELAQRAGVDYTLPEAADRPGPTAEDVEAAGEMSDAEREEMIRGMVSRLSDRLATEGGSAQEWSQLIVAYAAIGELDRAALIWAEAREVFGTRPEELEIVRAGARRAGITQ